MQSEHCYRLLDFGNGKRLEQWGSFIVSRPDPTARHPCILPPSEWQKAHAIYTGEKGKGEWKKFVEMPDSWQVQFDDFVLTAHLLPYKHVGIFPEQQANWRWMRKKAQGRHLNILNLFAYTGGATIALAKDGHKVTHVDASKPALKYASENAVANGLDGAIRWILDDTLTFAQKELKRGKCYDAMLLDPPAFGHSPSGTVWKGSRDLSVLLEVCAKLLSPHPCFLLLNGYADHDTPDSFRRLLTGILRSKTSIPHLAIDAQELYLESVDHRRLSTGIVARCEFFGAREGARSI